MLRASRESVYHVVKGSREFVVEVLRTPEGKSFVAIHMSLFGKYSLGDEEKEWDLLELEPFRAVKDTKVEYPSLPPEVRKALSILFK